MDDDQVQLILKSLLLIEGKVRQIDTGLASHIQTFGEFQREVMQWRLNLEQILLDEVKKFIPKDGEKGERGDRGEPGIPGKDGKDGSPGRDGVDGKDGIDGKDGRDGKNGINGKNGKDGKDGKDGEKGEKGDPGRDGTDISADVVKKLLESLRGEDRLSAKHIKDIWKYAPVASGGVQALSGGQHDHDDAYYTKSEVDALIAGVGGSDEKVKASATDATAGYLDSKVDDLTIEIVDDLLQVKSGVFASASHNHDDRYYTETEVDTLLAGKSDTGHTHLVADITDFSAGVETVGDATYLQIANNLSDVADVATSRTNLGLGTTDKPTFGALTLSAPTTSSLITTTGSTSAQSLLFLQATTTSTSSTSIWGFRWQPTFSHAPSGSQTSGIYGFYVTPTIDNTAKNVTLYYGTYNRTDLGSNYSGTVGTLYQNAVLTSNINGGAVTNMVGQLIAEQSGGTNNTNLLIGTTTPLTGNWSIYSASTRTSRFDGPIRMQAQTASRAVVFDSNKDIVSSSVTDTELGYVSGVTSAIQTQLDAKQALDATLTALAAYNTNGILVQTAADTFAGRTIVGTANQVIVTNGNGVSGNPTLSLPQDIGLSSNVAFGTLTLSSSSTPQIYIENSPGNVLTLSVDPSGAVTFNPTGLLTTFIGNINIGNLSQDTVVIKGNDYLESSVTTGTELAFLSGVTSSVQTQLNAKQGLDATLTALAAYNTNGIIVQTAADTFTGRSIAGTTDKIDVTNGNGVSGNPTITIAATYVGQNTITTLGTVSAGTWSATTIAANKGGTGITSYAVGDILYADTTSTLAKLADVATGNVLISGGVNTAPSWGKVTLGTHTTGNYVATITGTANQVTASASTGAVTLSLPQSIAVTSNVQFNSIEIDGDLNHDGTNVGFYGVAPTPRPTAYTQTYTTTSRTSAALTSQSLTDSTTGTANLAVAAANATYTPTQINNNFADLIAQINNLVDDVLNLKNVQTQMIDDLQLVGLYQ